MPLAMTKSGDNVVLKDISWGHRLKKRLQDMGLTPGVEIKVVSGNNRGAVIVSLRGSKLVLGRGMAQKILVESIG
ncbi:MAG: ferrous iron transport protein A [Firmicutes bacterium]|nr:ferrous iron transport protein A [Bacillota bacterium]MTI71298.1 ferrous iron transport protein A [Bacillota bacterium]